MTVIRLKQIRASLLVFAIRVAHKIADVAFAFLRIYE